MNLTVSIRYVSAALLMAAATAIASPASAQRGIDLDNNFSPLPNTCTLGQPCAGYTLPIVFNDNNEEFYGSTSNGVDSVQYFDNQEVFFYQEGVVSFGSELPLGASVVAGLASLGTGNWFAPSFGAATAMFAFDNGFGKIRVNWGPDVEDPDFQFVIKGTFINQTPIVEFGYRDGVFPQGLVSGYNYNPFSGGFSGPNPNSGDYVDLRYPGTQGGGVVPEPGVWALFILGFGLAGAALRRRESVLTQG